MYAKNRPDRLPDPPRREPRVPSYRQRVRVPANYSGHAIVDGEARSFDLSADPPLPHAEPPAPHFDDLPRVSELGVSGRRPLALPIPYGSDSDEGEPDAPAEAADPADPPEAAEVIPDAPAAVSRGLFDPAHFPFGHGIGSDELILLGLIALLLYENARPGGGRGDLDETVILLGILLLCG